MANKTYTSEELKNTFLEQINECIEDMKATFLKSKVEQHRETALFLIEEALYLEVLKYDEAFRLTDKVYNNAQHRIDLLS